MISGIIKLISHLDITVEQHFYHGKICRDKIIKRWQRCYPGLFHCGAIIQIYPKASIYKVRTDGTNGQKKEVEPIKPKIVRPPATYDNRTWV